LIPIVNIWSHLLGAIAFVTIAPVAYYKIVGVLNAVQWTDITVLYAFLAGAIVCLTMSASFHTFCCHSEKASYCKIYEV
jgi:adiponectin receptor